MKRVRIVAPGTVVVEHAATPDYGANDVLIKVATVGICGSDMHAFAGRHPFISLPVVPGHEFAGTVAAVGNQVDANWVGQRVTAVPSLVCGTCYNCRNGRYNICNELRVIGCQAEGAMADLVRVPANMLVKLPESMEIDQGALVEPLAVAVGAVHRAGDVAGKRAVVFGAGTIGLFVLQVLRTFGAKEVTVVDPLTSRRALADRLGADYTLNPREVDVVTWAHNKFGLDGVDLSFECVGIANTLNQAIRVNRKGTRVVVVGVFASDVQVSMGLVQDREIELVGTLMYRKHHFEEAVWLLASERVQGMPLVTHTLPLVEAPQAFETLRQNPAQTVKVLLQL